MYELIIERHFFAAHALTFLDGTTEPLHAHDWVAEVRVRAARLDGSGLVMDFHELERVVGEVVGAMGNASLNELPSFAGLSPSAERVAEHVYKELLPRLRGAAELVQVTITEAPGCRAAYHPAAGL